MRRRLLLAKALVHHPHILVLDEPTAGVDIELRKMLWDNIRKLNQDGMTIILTTHYLEEAQEMCDEIAIISDGEVIVRDRTENLLAMMDAKTLLIVPDGATTHRGARRRGPFHAHGWHAGFPIWPQQDLCRCNL
jgi:ABC-2 type transport system ATP-binding protein